MAAAFVLIMIAAPKQGVCDEELGCPKCEHGECLREWYIQSSTWDPWYKLRVELIDGDNWLYNCVEWDGDETAHCAGIHCPEYKGWQQLVFLGIVILEDDMGNCTLCDCSQGSFNVNDICSDPWTSSSAGGA